MELIKFLKELKNNKYLTLNQFEYDIQKLKIMVDDPKIKFNYVKTKGLKNYINDLKTAATEGADTIRESAKLAYSTVSKIMPNYKPKTDDDIYLLLGFLLSIDNLDDLHFDNEDEILALIGMLLVDGSESELNNDHDGNNDHHGNNDHDDFDIETANPSQINDTLIEKIRQLEEQLSHADLTIARQANNSERKRHEISRLASEISRIRDHAVEQIEHFSNQALNAKLRADKIDFEAKIIEHNAQILSDDYNRLQQQYKMNIQQTIDQIEVINNENRELQIILLEHRKKTDELNTELDNARQEADKAREAIRANEHSSAQELLKMVERATIAETSLAKANENLIENELKQLQLENQKYAAENLIAESNRQIKTIQDQLKDMEEKYEGAKANAEGAKAIANTTNVQMNFMKFRIAAYDVEIGIARDEIKTLEDRHKADESKLAEQNSELTSQSMAIANYQRILDENILIITNYYSEKDELTKAIASSSAKSQKDLDELRSKLEKVKSELETSTSLRMLTENALEAANARYQSLESQISIIKDELRRSEDSLRTSQAHAASAENSKTEAEERARESKQSERTIKIQLDLQLAEAQRDLEAAKQNEDKSKEALQKANQAHEAAISEIKTSLTKAESKISELTKEFEAKDKECQESIAKAIEEASALKLSQAADSAKSEQNKKLAEEVISLSLELKKQRGLNITINTALEGCAELNESLNVLLSENRKKLEISDKERQEAQVALAQEVSNFANARDKFAASLKQQTHENQKLKKSLLKNEEKLNQNEEKLNELRRTLGIQEKVMETQGLMLGHTRQVLNQGTGYKDSGSPLRSLFQKPSRNV